MVPWARDEWCIHVCMCKITGYKSWKHLQRTSYVLGNYTLFSKLLKFSSQKKGLKKVGRMGLVRFLIIYMSYFIWYIYMLYEIILNVRFLFLSILDQRFPYLKRMGKYSFYIFHLFICCQNWNKNPYI